MVGLWLKTALFPVHAWLPGAYSQASTTAAGLLAPLGTKVMIYVMIRVMLSVFTPAYIFHRGLNPALVVWLASAAVVAGAVMALAERNLKRMLTYIIVGEVGYMVGGAWLGTEAGMTGAVLHVLNDAAMTLCVFMAASNIRYQRNSLAHDRLSELFARMPFTMAGLCVGALSIIGVPPTCGFFSKWYLLLGAIEAGHYVFAAALILSSLVAVVLFFRVFEIAYYPPPDPRGRGHHHRPPAMNEAPAIMVVPLLVVAAGLIVMGLFTGGIVSAFVVPALGAGLG
jgi:multicomponent Na+:H+ antiporter subunit D